MCDFCSNCKKYKDGKCKEEEFCIRRFKLEQYFNLSNLPPIALHTPILNPDSDIEEYNKLADIRNDIVNFINSGNNLYICSSTPGNGKSTWAYKLAMEYINCMWKKSNIRTLVYFVNVSNLLAFTKTAFEDTDYIKNVINTKKSIMEADLVIWDDLGVKTLSEFDRDMILDLIDYRISHKKSNIYTSNNLLGVTETKYGERLKSRVYNLSTPIIFHGEDKRGITVDSESSD